METLKLGSRGDSVKLLQKKLGITADGSFGPKTEIAVKEFQKKHKLKADGIVGAGTWKALGVTSTDTQSTNSKPSSVSSKCVDESVIYLPLSVHVTKSPNRKPMYISIHYTAGGSSAPGRAKANKSIFESRNASADFGVDDRDIVQFNPDILNYYCWAVGDNKNPYSSGGRLKSFANNKNTISIEICSNLKSGTTAQYPNHAGWFFTEKSIENAIKLTKILMKKYNIPLDRVVRHYDITGKLCPGIKGWNDESLVDEKTGKTRVGKNNSEEWLKFKNRLLF